MYATMSAAKSTAVKTPVKPQGSNDGSTELKVAEKNMLYSVLQGLINFAKVATDIEVPNAEAA